MTTTSELPDRLLAGPVLRSQALAPVAGHRAEAVVGRWRARHTRGGPGSAPGAGADVRSDATSGAQRADEAARADLDALCRTLEELKREVEWLKAREQAREAARLEGDGALDRLMAALPGQPLTDTEVDELLTPEALALLRRPFADE